MCMDSVSGPPSWSKLTVHLREATTCQYLLNSAWCFVSLSLIPAEMVVGLTLCMSCACNHNHCKPIWMPLPCLENTFTRVIHYHCQDLSIPTCCDPWALGVGSVLQTSDLGLNTPQPLHNPLLSICWPVVGFCVNHHLFQKKLLLGGQRDASIRCIKIKTLGTINYCIYLAE